MSSPVAALMMRTCLLMLLISAPVIIEDHAARRFLEQAQGLGGEMTRVLALTRSPTGGPAGSGNRLNDAVQQLQSAAAPLLQLLSREVHHSIQRIGQSTRK